MIKAAYIAVLFLTSTTATLAQTPDVHPMTLAEIDARGGKPMPRDDVVKLVTGAKVNWAAFGGGERIWTNVPDGTVSATRIGTGVGSFNPHYKSGHGHWSVKDDGTFCADMDFGMMMREGWCWKFFNAEGDVLMNVEPVSPGSKITFMH